MQDVVFRLLLRFSTIRFWLRALAFQGFEILASLRVIGCYCLKILELKNLRHLGSRKNPQNSKHPHLIVGALFGKSVFSAPLT